jgi:HSP20 family molecular chaperone IbpA
MVKNTGERITLNRPVEGKFIPWNPIEEFVTLNNRFNELFGRGFGYTPLARLLPADNGFEPMIDVVYTEQNIEFYVALPGFTSEMINVEALPEAIVIAGERKPLYVLPKEQIVEGWAGVSATFRVSYPLNVEIDPIRVTATLHEGVLHVVLPLNEKANVACTPVKVIAK